METSPFSLLSIVADEEAKNKIRELVSIANSIWSTIVMKEDTTFNHEDGKIPILDLKV